ncbi:MAG: site-2 protease family protein [Candidatus Nanosyncoccaceae bacterium]|jgi:Zn-dependent protease
MNFWIILIYIVIIVMSMVVHEMAHAFASNKLGDDTAKLYNRLSLNPLRHIDPFMTILLPILLVISGAPVFGGAKPVLVNKRKLKYGDWGMAIVAMAGPLANLLLSFLFYALAWCFTKLELIPLVNVLMIVVIVNLGFFLFNILPIVPLDGSRLLYAFAPSRFQDLMDRFEHYGIWIIFGLVLIAQPYLFAYISSSVGFFLRLYSRIFVL